MLRERLAAAQDHCPLCNARCTKESHASKVASLMKLSRDKQREQLLSMYLT
jgi:DNA repair exonuclease SbcCD ATPase subunit